MSDNLIYRTFAFAGPLCICQGADRDSSDYCADFFRLHHTTKLGQKPLTENPNYGNSIKFDRVEPYVLVFPLDLDQSDLPLLFL